MQRPKAARAPVSAQRSGFRRSLDWYHGTFAMQKVEGSSPFIRFRKAPLSRGPIARTRTVILMVEPATVKPTGD
jgi:hypothetical protein